MWISFDRIMPGLTWCGTRRVVERELTERRRTLLAVAGGMASLLLGPDTSWLTGSAYTIYAVAAGSFFVVGAVAFKRLVFVKTYAAILVLDVALGMLAGLALGVFVLFNRDVVPRDWLETAVSVTAQVLMVAVTLFNWVMAYRWLTYTDVID